MVARDAGIDLGTILVFLSALLAVTFLFLFSDASIAQIGEQNARDLPLIA